MENERARERENKIGRMIEEENERGESEKENERGESEKENERDRENE